MLKLIIIQVIDSRCISEYILTLVEAAICWRSYKQICVATSTTHAEYMVLYDVCTEVAWLKYLLEELELGEYIKYPIKIYVDNMEAMKLVERTNISE